MKKITFKELIELIEQKKEPKEIIVESTKYKLNGSTYYDVKIILLNGKGMEKQRGD